MAEGQIMTMDVDTRELAAWERELAKVPERMPQVIAATLNWVGDRVRTQVVRDLAQVTGLPYGEVRDATDTRRASARGDLTYTITETAGYTTLRHFDPVEVDAGVMARPWGKRQLFRGAFIVPSLNAQVYKRVGATRNSPIEVLYGPSLPVEMMRGTVPGAVFLTVQDALPERLEHEVGRMLDQMQAGAKG